MQINNVKNNGAIFRAPVCTYADQVLQKFTLKQKNIQMNELILFITATIKMFKYWEAPLS